MMDSTREQAGTSDSFLLHAFDALGEAYPREGSLWTRGRELARLVASRRCVVVLDGIEPLQYGPGSDLLGRLKDAGLRGFLAELTAVGTAERAVVTDQPPSRDGFVSSTILRSPS